MHGGITESSQKLCEENTTLRTSPDRKKLSNFYMLDHKTYTVPFSYCYTIKATPTII